MGKHHRFPEFITKNAYIVEKGKKKQAPGTIRWEPQMGSTKKIRKQLVVEYASNREEGKATKVKTGRVGSTGGIGKGQEGGCIIVRQGSSDKKQKCGEALLVG